MWPSVCVVRGNPIDIFGVGCSTNSCLLGSKKHEKFQVNIFQVAYYYFESILVKYKLHRWGPLSVELGQSIRLENLPKSQKYIFLSHRSFIESQMVSKAAPFQSGLKDSSTLMFYLLSLNIWFLGSLWQGKRKHEQLAYTLLGLYICHF